MEEITFKAVEEEDLGGILEVYNQYIQTSTATFRLAPITVEELKSFIFLDHSQYGAYLIHCRGELAGFCFLTPYRNQGAYDRTVEIGIYLRSEFTRRGLGLQAVKHLEKVAAAKGFKIIIASICGENTASLGLFRKLGYAQCGDFKRVGEKFGRVLDVIYFQRMLEFEASDRAEDVRARQMTGSGCGHKGT